MSKFDHPDFERNPEKYRMFKTARTAGHIVTHNGEKDVPADKEVGLVYAGVQINFMYQRVEPVYVITVDGVEWGPAFASSLKDFVL